MNWQLVIFSALNACAVFTMGEYNKTFHLGKKIGWWIATVILFCIAQLNGFVYIANILQLP